MISFEAGLFAERKASSRVRLLSPAFTDPALGTRLAQSPQEHANIGHDNHLWIISPAQLDPCMPDLSIGQHFVHN